MNESLEPDAIIRPDRPVRRRILVWLQWMAVAGVTTGCVFLWLAWHPKVPAGPVHLTRGEDGRFVVADGSDPSGFHLELQAAQITASNQLASSSGESRPSQARFACGRMAIFNDSQHLLMQRVGRQMLEHLKGLHGFEQVDYYPLGGSPEPGELRPDVTVWLTLEDVKTSGLPGSRTLDARIGLSAGNTLMRYPHHEFDGLGPPMVEWNLSATLDHHSTTRGLGTPSARYKLAAADIGKQLGEALAKKVNALYEKDGPLPPLPEAFYPAYTPPPEVPGITDGTAELVASYRGLMSSNESLWRLETARGLAEVLVDLEVRLKESGWRTGSLSTEANKLPHLRTKRGEDVLMVYPERKQDGPTSGTIVVKTPNGPEPEPQPAAVLVHFVDRMSREEAARAVEGLLDDGCPVETLLIFQSVLQGRQRNRLMERVEAECPTSPAAWIVLAEWHHGAKRSEKAKDALGRAHVLSRTVPDKGNLKSRIDKLAEKLGEKLPRDAPIEPELLAALGFVEITPAGAIQKELVPDETALFYADRDGQLATIAIRIVRSGSGDGGRAAYGIAYVHAWGTSRSWGSGSLVHSMSVGGLGSVRFHAEPIAGGPKFRLSAHLDASN